MAKTVTISQTGAGTSGWVILNFDITPFQVTVTTSVTGTVSYTIETTQNDFWTYPVGTVRTFTAASAASTGAQISLQNAVYGVRINNASGSGTITADITQAGITNM